MATILIVEDEREISALTQLFIEEHGHKTLSAATPDEALAILNGSEVVDALFVDIILKGDLQAGIELAKQAVQRKPNLKVLYSTGLAVTDDIKALVVPGSTILEKPYSEDQLLAGLSTLGTVSNLTLIEAACPKHRAQEVSDGCTDGAWQAKAAPLASGSNAHSLSPPR
jgi:CheY-like chemotaxis protein